VEGLTEFLPVSSTAHLRITEALLHINLQDPFWKMYTVVIQLGAILALPVYFGRRILNFISTFPGGENGDRTILNHPLSLTLIAFVVTAIPSYLLSKQIGENLESLLVMGWSLIIGGVGHVGRRRHVPPAARRATRGHERSPGHLDWRGADPLRALPRTSRSMSTIAAAQVAGLSRPAALEFSFFVSMPTMVAATGFDLLKALGLRGDEGDALSAVVMDGHRWVILAIGFVVSFIVALGVVAWFMNWVRARGFVPFAIYRIVAGIVLLVLVARGWR
jgi:undecaprenyl-diphosphatase